jgi:glycosyltransferase involved in cell wall biosynthesis
VSNEVCKLKIALISTSTIPVGSHKYGGIEKLVYDFSETLTSLGHSVRVAAPVGSRLPEAVELLPTVSLPGQRDRDDLAYNMYASEVADSDVVHDFSYGHIYAKKNPGRPTLNVIWDNLTAKYDKAPKNIAAISEWQRRTFELLYERPARLVPTVCADEKRFIPSYENNERFLIMGKMSSDKAIISAIALCKLLNVSADVVGGGLPTDDPTYRHNVMRLCDGERFTFWGEVNDDVKIQLMQRAKAVLNPRFMPEAHWHVGVEAMLCGTPVIVYGHSSYSEIVANGVSGYVCRPFDEGEMIVAMTHVGNLKKKQVREYALRYSRSRVVGECVKTYEKVAAGGSW